MTPGIAFIIMSTLCLVLFSFTKNMSFAVIAIIAAIYAGAHMVLDRLEKHK